MARTTLRSGQLLDGAGVNIDDLDITTSGKCVISKVIAGNGIGLSQTGADAGTGAVTISVSDALSIHSVTLTKAAIGSTSTDGAVLQNTTAAAAGAQQWSPRLRLSGRGWKTNATAGSQIVDWIVEVIPIQGAANPTSELRFSSQVNGAGYVRQVSISSNGDTEIATGGLAVGGATTLEDVSAGTVTVPTIYGSNVTGSTLTLVSTSHATKGKIVFGTSAYDEANNRLGLGTASPSVRLHVSGSSILATNTTIDPDTYASGIVAGTVADGSGFSGVGIGGNNGTGDSWGIVHNGGGLYFGMQDGVSANTMQTYMSFETNRNLNMVGTSGNVGIKASSFGTNAVGVLGLGNGTAPTTSPADMVQLYSVDLSAGNATLGIRTETAVATESVTSDRTLSVKINGTTYKICLKA